MNDKLKILDCTLRDGGYINDWFFGKNTIQSIIGKLIEAQTDFIEVGFLRNCEYNINKTLYNSITELKNILPLRKGKSKIVMMALHNLYDINKLENNDGTVDLIRVTFHNYDIDEGLEFISKVIAKGYPVSCNPINIMGYSDRELIDLLDKINKIQPTAFSIVDTFGSMMQNDLQRIYSLVEHNLDKSIKIGLHLHENLGLSFSLAQYFISMKAVNRQCIIDGSLYGMGRVPGNLSVELLMEYLNKFKGLHYQVDSVYDAINDYIENYRAKEPWGYSIAYALSAKYNLHRNYSEFLLGKGKLRTKDVNYILASVEEKKKSSFDKHYIEGLYEKYQNVSVDDYEDRVRIKKILRGKSILLLAPGTSLIKYKEVIMSHIKNTDPLVISVNFVDLMYGSFLSFFTSLRRYSQYKEDLTTQQLIISSNISKEVKDAFAVVDYYKLSCDEIGLFDNSMVMCLRLLSEIGINNVSIAGFDGFHSKNTNYFSGDHGNLNNHTELENHTIAGVVEKLQNVIKIQFITPSKYQRQ